MTATGIISFKFIINLCRCLQLFLQAISTYQWGWAVHFIIILNLLRNINICIGVIQFLLYQLFTENRCQFFCRHRFQGTRIQKRCRFFLHIRPHIIPLLWHLLLIQINFVRNLIFFHAVSPLISVMFLLVGRSGFLQ
ncbi:hypothetical protein DSECCO2_80310 [anaerobic digester metagenome]